MILPSGHVAMSADSGSETAYFLRDKNVRAIFGCGSPAYEETVVFKPSVRHTIILLIIAALPTLTMILLADLEKNLVASMFVFHWVAAVLAPIAYCVLFEGASCSPNMSSCMRPVQYLREQCAGFAVARRQALISVVLFFVATGGGVGIVAALAQWCWLVEKVMQPVRQRAVEDGLTLSVTAMVLFMLYFTFINSIIEELFWRGFLIRRLGASVPALLTSSGFYALYHYFVLLMVLPEALGFNIWGSAIATLGLVLAGVLLAAAYFRLGVLVAWSLHAVADATIMLLLTVAYYGAFVPAGCRAAAAHNASSLTA